MFNNGPQGEKPWFLPNEPEASKPPKSAPGDGLKQFAQSGALQAFKDPHGASEGKKQGEAGAQLMNYLNQMGL